MNKTTIALLVVNAVFLAGRICQELDVTAQAGGMATDNGDTNGDGERDISDASFLLAWLSPGGPEPVEIAGRSDLENRVETLVPVVTPLFKGPPTSFDVVPVASTLRTGPDTFEIFLHNERAPVNGDFSFMATAS